MTGRPLLIASFLMPALTSEIVAGSIPSEIPIDAAEIAGLLSWMLEPVRPIAIGLAVAGGVFVATSFGVGIVRQRQA